MLQAEVRIPQSLARHARTRVVSSSAAGLRDCGRHARTRVADLRDCGAYHASACQFPATDNSDDLTIVSCNQPHDAETFHAFEFRGDQFPTDDELNQASDEICGLMFEYYVGKPVADSTLDYEWVGPDQELWAQGDHIVECYAFAKDDSKLNRSIWNSNM